MHHPVTAACQSWQMVGAHKCWFVKWREEYRVTVSNDWMFQRRGLGNPSMGPRKQDRTLSLLLFLFVAVQEHVCPKPVQGISSARSLEEQFLNLKQSTKKYIFGFVKKNLYSSFEEHTFLCCISNCVEQGFKVKLSSTFFTFYFYCMDFHGVLNLTSPKCEYEGIGTWMRHDQLVADGRQNSFKAL